MFCGLSVALWLSYFAEQWLGIQKLVKLGNCHSEERKGGRCIPSFIVCFVVVYPWES